MSGRPEGCVSSPERTAAVLAVSPSPAERVRLRKILSQENWRLYEASDCCEALPLLRDQSVPVLLCKHDHVDGNWEDLLNTTASLPAPPNLVVFTRLADESLWAKVLNVSGFDVLITPFEPEEILRVTFAAWSRWQCDFGASTVNKAEAADRAVVSAGKCCRTARSDGRDLNVSG
ncbi:MAG: hypothetical protein WBL61_21760 [Bryobacteraceae bacterium]